MLGQTQSPNSGSGPSIPSGSDAVWTFRGYQMRPAEFNTAMVHYYRAEVQRSNVWRQRLDTTTNWAVVATGAAISFALSSPNNHYGVLILSTDLSDDADPTKKKYAPAHLFAIDAALSAVRDTR